MAARKNGDGERAGTREGEAARAGELAIVTDPRSRPYDDSLAAASQPLTNAHEALITYGFDMRVIERNPLENPGVIDRKRIYYDYDVYRVFRGLPRGGTLGAIRLECIIALATGVLFSWGFSSCSKL